MSKNLVLPGANGRCRASSSRCRPERDISDRCRPDAVHLSRSEVAPQG
jgi:hypothetical protein